jgi:hypothetical protein
MPMADLARQDEYGFDPLTGAPIGVPPISLLVG